MTATRTLVRGSVVTALAVSAVIPAAFLIALSVSEEWFYPSLLPRRWSIDRWALAVRTGEVLAGSLWTSTALALGAGLTSAVAGLAAGRAISRLRGWRRRVAVSLAFLPVAVPPLALAVGLQYSMLRIGLGGSFAGVMFAHFVPALGYATLFFIGIFAVYDMRAEDEARSLGANQRDVLKRVTLPLLRRPLIEAFALGFLVSWAQVPLTLLIGQGLVITLPVELLSYVSAGQDHLAATAGLILTIPPLVLLAVTGIAVRRLSVVVV